MRLLRATLLAGLAYAMLPAALASADTLLWTSSFDLGGGSGGNYQDKIEVSLFLNRSTEPTYQWMNRLFDGPAYWIGTDDDGRIRTLSSAADDPQFTAYAARLTDGLSGDRLGIYRAPVLTNGTINGGASNDWLEPVAFYGNAADPRVDLKGYQITRIVQHVKSIDITLNSTQFQSNGRVEFSIYGDLVPTTVAAPLPGVAWGGIALFGMLGGKGLLSRRKKAAEPAAA